ncbi:MAG: protein phosphatase 2C domain-containing protein [Vicinamibacterales bacterium]
MSGRFDTATLSRTGERRANEDAAGVRVAGDASCAVVADGLGGHRGGAVASRTVVDAVLEAFDQGPEVSAEAARALVERAQGALLARQREESGLAEMRSTIVVLLADRRQAIWAHVGDSRLYLVRGGRVVSRTRDHSVTQSLVDAGEVAPRDQGRHEDRSRLLKVLGKEDVEPTVHDAEALCRGDAFLLCTDGLWEHVDDLDVEIDAAGGGDAAAWVSRLEARLLRADARPADNYTAVAVRVAGADLPEPPVHDPDHLPRPSRAGLESRRGTAPPIGPTGRPSSSPRLPWAMLLGLVVVAAMGGAAFLRGGLGRTIVGQWFGGGATGADAVETSAPTPPETPEASAGTGVGATGAASADARPSSPADVEDGRVYRVSVGRTYGSLMEAIREAGAGEVLWLGAGRLHERQLTIDKAIEIVGAGRDRTVVDLEGGVARVTADTGALESVELCCSGGDVLDIGGRFAGRLSHLRLARGSGFGLVLRDRATPVVTDVDFADNTGGNLKTLDQAQPAMR